MQKEWDQRYAGAEYFYGRAPNVFLVEQLRGLPLGLGLFLAEGEGRNAVYAASLGHSVFAVDFSREGKRKALTFARERGVTIEYTLGDVTQFAWDNRTYDFTVLCFLHLSVAARQQVHQRVVKSLVPGGKLIVETFAKAQFGRKSGGPPRLDLLYSLSDLVDDFAGIRWQQATEEEVELLEGRGHSGLAVVNRLVGFKL
jgi:SAM-dependent methyltransferase